MPCTWGVKLNTLPEDLCTAEVVKKAFSDAGVAPEALDDWILEPKFNVLKLNVSFMCWLIQTARQHVDWDTIYEEVDSIPCQFVRQMALVDPKHSRSGPIQSVVSTSIGHALVVQKRPKNFITTSMRAM